MKTKKYPLALGFWNLTSFVVLIFSASWALAAVPEPESGGKFFKSKGTKAAEGYEGRAGTPVYEYGKGLQLWELHVIPSVDYSYHWDNNVFLEESGRKSDYYHHLNAGATGELPIQGGQHVLSASYFVDSDWYDRFKSQDYTGQTAGVGAELNFVPFSLAAQENYRTTVSRADTEFTSRTAREENTVHALLEIPFASFFLESELFDFNVNYRSPENSGFDHHDLTVYQRLGIDITPATQLLGEYGYKNIHYSKVDDREADANQAMIGLRGNFTERVTYQLWGGFQSRTYDTDPRPDFQGFVARSAILFDVSEINQIVLKGDRSPQESTFDGQSYYVRNRLEFGWRRQLAQRLFFRTSEIAQYNEYSRITVRDNTEKTRRDLDWVTSLGLEYTMPNDLVTIYGEYRFSARESNTALLSYDDQTANVGIRSKF